MDNIDRFQVAFPAEFGWIATEYMNGNSFATSLHDAILRFGRLTEKQLDCVRRNVNRVMSAHISAPQVAQDKLMEAFDNARKNKLIRLKIRFDGFFCYPASETSANAGGIYVKSDEREYLGKITNGRFQASRECSETVKQAIVKVMADPLTEAIAYGKQTGNCAICGRFLENPESVARGIGPICAGNYGF